MFRTSRPVTDQAFHDRTEELARLELAISKLAAGQPEWVAVIGPRKVGKTSLVLELERRTRSDGDLVFAVLDAENERPLSWELFRTYALRAADALLGPELAASLEVAVATRTGYADLLEADVVRSLPREVTSVLRALPSNEMEPRFVRQCLDLPEALASALDRRIVIAFDEFQELASEWSRKLGDPLPVIRSAWQKHARVAYIVSGSGRTLLEEMVTAKHSPFFQHFSLLYLDHFTRADAVSLLVGAAPQGRAISKTVAELAFEAIGGHPFYLQLLGEEITAHPPPYDARTVKEALQEVLFSRTGRLGLYFQNVFDRLVGQSSHMAATLEALAAAAGAGGAATAHRLSELGQVLGLKSGDLVRYLERLGDAVKKTDDGRYAVADPTFALWLAWRRPGGSAIPMSVLGDAAEREVALTLARMGFDLVYQSRASRGAFDLLATRGASQLGIQVKASPLPLTFEGAAFQRMEAEAARFGWSWLVAAAPPGEAIAFLDPAAATGKKTRRLGKDAALESVLAWLDRKPDKPKPDKPKPNKRPRTR
ncbi:MAG: ATP-binding protein [Polyangiaceae bacterium]